MTVDNRCGQCKFWKAVSHNAADPRGLCYFEACSPRDYGRFSSACYKFEQVVIKKVLGRRRRG